MAKNIKGYLLDAPNVFVQSRSKMLSPGIPAIMKGSQPTDGGNLILSEEERNILLEGYPEAEFFIKRFVGSYGLINNKIRYCLWPDGISPNAYRHISFILDRLKKLTEARLESATESVRQAAAIPRIFTQIRQPDTDYLALPKVSSERRRYIPIAYLSADVVGSDLTLYMVPEVSRYLLYIENPTQGVGFRKA